MEQVTRTRRTAAATRPPICTIESCDAPANVPGAARGLCKKHYGRWRKHGDASVTLISVTNDPTCSEPGCSQRHVAKGLCAGHYAQARKARQPSCEVSGCANLAHCKGLCQAHYRRQRVTGSVRAERPIASALPAHMQWCNQCSTVKPLGEFPTAKERKRGVASFCRECFGRLCRTRYRPVIYAQQAAWRRANPHRPAAYGRRYRQAHPEKIRAKHARLRARHPERYRAYARAGDRNRRARERLAAGRASSGQMAARWDYFAGLCWMCGSRADVLDHVKPLARGGSGWPSNLRPACSRCNLKKSARWPYPLEVASACRLHPIAVT